MRGVGQIMLCLVFTNGEIKTQIKLWLGWRRVRSDLDINHYLSGEFGAFFARLLGMVTYKILSLTIIN